MNEKLKDYNKQWRKDRPEYFQEFNRKRQERKWHDISKRELEALYNYCNSSCMYCGLSEEEHLELFGQKLHKDHAINNGSNGIDNCVLACRICNSSKWNRDWDEWYTPNNPIYDEGKFKKIRVWLDSFKENVLTDAISQLEGFITNGNFDNDDIDAVIRQLKNIQKRLL